MGAILLILAASTAHVTAAAPTADTISTEIETADADRFADLFERTDGTPTAEQLQHDYIDRGTYGLHVFMPHRIVDADNLARAVAADPDSYGEAVRTCLPIVKNTSAEVRAAQMAFRGLFADKPLPRAYLVMGAGNSGGTAGPGALVLGLEVLCRTAETPDALRDLVSGFYAHETVHALQGDQAAGTGNILLRSVLREGAADYIATLVTGKLMDERRATWAAPREAELWRQFLRDLDVTRGVSADGLVRGTPAGDAYFRWIANADVAPPGWPGEVGYWMGQRIWQRWYDQQPDRQAALHEMLDPRDAEAVLAIGRFPSP